MNLRVTVEGSFPSGRAAVISNHLGYADIVVFASLHECVYCAKAEIRKWPLVGWMTMMAGTVFIDRGRGGSALKAKGGMLKAADAGIPVMFFPEGTTSNGDGILPFHSGLLQQAISVDAPITAAHIRYTLDEPNAPGTCVRDDVHYWGDVSILKHIFRFVSLRGVHAHVRFAEAPLHFAETGVHRKIAAMDARAAVVELA